MLSLAEMATEVLTTADGREKTALSHAHAKTWFEARRAGREISIGRADPPLRPARPDRPELLEMGASWVHPLIDELRAS